jgi:hypothetical protein
MNREKHQPVYRTHKALTNSEVLKGLLYSSKEFIHHGTYSLGVAPICQPDLLGLSTL